MFERFRRARARRRENEGVVTRLFGAVTNAARAPVLYTRLGVADTVMGRFEMLVLHVFLLQHRAKGGSPAFAALAQDVVDVTFADLDASLREIGIGDVAMPKRMKRLAKMVYGRWEAYGQALSANDIDGMAEALRRNAYVEGGNPDRASDLAGYAADVAKVLADEPERSFLTGTIEFPRPAIRTEPV